MRSRRDEGRREPRSASRARPRTVTPGRAGARAAAPARRGSTAVLDAPRRVDAVVGPPPAPRPVGPTLPRVRAVTAPRHRLLMVCVAVLSVGLIGVLLLNTVISQGAFRQRELELALSRVSDDEEDLAAAVQQAESPINVEKRARALGMVPAGSPVFLRLSDGAILGEPVPAPPAPGKVSFKDAPGIQPSKAPKASASPSASPAPANPLAGISPLGGRSPSPTPTPQPTPGPGSGAASAAAAPAGSASGTPAGSASGTPSGSAPVTAPASQPAATVPSGAHVTSTPSQSGATP